MVKTQVSIASITAQEMRDTAIAAGVNVPIEQTWVWAEFEETFPDRHLLGFFEICRAGEPVALLALTRYRYHGFEFLWCKHGPVWLVEQSAELEQVSVRALVAWARKKRPLTAFLRLHLRFPGPDARPPMQITTYDRTVIVALSEDEPELMAGFKPRTRQDIRRAGRKYPVDLADETALGVEDFTPYHEIMAETADRQGFTPWSAAVYENLLRSLKYEHSRLYAARVDGRLVAFTIFTISGSEVVYYYAAANEEGRERRAPAQLLYFALSQLGVEGYKTADLMGIGSDLAPSLNALNSFKTGFAKEITEVEPAYDIPVSKSRYRALEALRAVGSALRSVRARFGRRGAE